MPYGTPAIDSPADLLTLAATRADEYLLEMDLERDFDSRYLTTRYLIETVAALRDSARGGLTDKTGGVDHDHDHDRLELAAFLLATLDHDHHPRVQDHDSALTGVRVVLTQGLRFAILSA